MAKQLQIVCNLAGIHKLFENWLDDYRIQIVWNLAGKLQIVCNLVGNYKLFEIWLDSYRLFEIWLNSNRLHCSYTKNTNCSKFDWTQLQIVCISAIQLQIVRNLAGNYRLFGIWLAILPVNDSQWLAWSDLKSSTTNKVVNSLVMFRKSDLKQFICTSLCT